jgi:dienelactone hydrolase
MSLAGRNMRRTFINILTLAFAAICVSVTAQAKDLSGWGIVVMHGKGGGPNQMSSVSSALSAAGAAVIAPQMSWSGGYKTYSATLDEVAGHIASLRSRGATRIALVGQSLGANVALGYGAQRGGVAAVVAMAPGHQPDRFIGKTGASLARAKQAIAEGHGNEIGTYQDINQGQDFEVRTTAAAYVSFFDPGGPAIMGRNAAQLQGAKLLWIIGTADAGAQSVAHGGTIISVPGGHFQTPNAGAAEVVTWLEALP